MESDPRLAKTAVVAIFNPVLDPTLSATMSVHAYKTADGTRWQVRWRETNGRVRTRSLTSKRDALAFDADVKARKHKGEALPRPGRETLAAAYDEWWRLRGSTLAPATQRTYKAVWDAHVRGRFDHHRLNELSADPQLFEQLTADMRERDVGPASQRKVLVVISAVLTAAVEWKKMPTNPVWRMRKPPGTRQRIPRPFPPVVVERIRLRMARRETKDSSGARAAADACLVTLMSYAGLRPGEALALTWADIGSHTIAVDKAVRDGEEGPTKTGAVRSVPLVGPLQNDLDTLRWTFGLPDNNRLVIPASDGGHWTRSELNNWRNRVWSPAVAWLADGDPTLASLATARPYDCRGSFVSLHLRAGASPLEVAKWAGHSPAVMFRHYANVIEELQGEPTISAEEQILRAREAVEETEREELDRLVVDLLQHPTVSGPGPLYAASKFYAPAN
jgi:integrase